MILLLSAAAHAFCGTFVGGDGSLLTNHASQVVLAHEEGQTTMTLAMDYTGDLTEFALILPVPEVLTADDVTSPDPQLLEDLDTYSMPREAAYTCDDIVSTSFSTLGCASSFGCQADNSLSGFDTGGIGDAAAGSVSVESSFSVAGYEFVVLSAEESADLELWLDNNGYALPAGGEAVLQEYIDAGAYFLAAKVSLTEAAPGERQWLPPIQIRYAAETWSLPIRIGTISADGPQEVIVYALDPQEEGEVGIANYPQVELEDECMRPDDSDLGTYYADQLDAAFGGKAGWLVEYSWELETVAGGNGYHCDPCTTVIGIPEDQVHSLGLESYPAHLTRLRLRYSPEEATQDVALFSSGITGVTSQIRYIQANHDLEDLYPVCGEGFVEDPGTCFTPERVPLFGVGAAAPLGVIGALAGLTALRRRRV